MYISIYTIYTIYTMYIYIYMYVCIYIEYTRSIQYIHVYTCIYIYIHAYTCIYMHIHVLYMHTYEHSCEPCSKCRTSWHQIRNCVHGIAIVLLTHKQVMLMAYALCSYLVFRGAYAGLRSQE